MIEPARPWVGCATSAGDNPARLACLEEPARPQGPFRAGVAAAIL